MSSNRVQRDKPFISIRLSGLRGPLQIDTPKDSDEAPLGGFGAAADRRTGRIRRLPKRSQRH